MCAAVLKQQTEQIKPVNPFCREYVPHDPVDYSSQQFIYRVSNMTVDRDTLMVSPEFEKVDLIAEIQSCKMLCGLEYMKVQLQRGLAKPEDFMAKPEDFHDVTQVPQDIHTASRLADMRSGELAKLAKAIGIQDNEELTPELFEQRLKQYIADNWKQPEQSAEVK